MCVLHIFGVDDVSTACVVPAAPDKPLAEVAVALERAPLALLALRLAIDVVDAALRGGHLRERVEVIVEREALERWTLALRHDVALLDVAACELHAEPHERRALAHDLQLLCRVDAAAAADREQG